MTAQPGISEPLIRFQASGWIISLCLHGTAIFLAGLLAARIGLAPPSSSFHWDVTVIGAQPPATPAQAAPDPQTLAAAVIRPTQRRAPATAVRPTPSHTAPQTTPTTTTASLPVDAPYEAATVLTPPTQEPQQLLEPTRTGPLPEPEVTRPEPEVARMEPQPALHATSAPVEAPLPPQTAASPATATPLASESSLPTSAVPSSTTEQVAAPSQTASLAPSSNTTQATRKPDYGWLAGPLLQRIETLKQYPVTARLQRLEGRVVVRIVIQEDGDITSATIAKSSGHDQLDQAALETIRQASPLTLSQPLGKSSVTMQIPLGYYLDR